MEEMRLTDTLGPEQLAVIRGAADRYLTDFDAHVDTLVAEQQRQIPEYAAVPIDDIRQSIVGVLDSVLTTLTTLDVEAENVAALQELARRRVEQGFPLDALARSLHLAAQSVLAVIVPLAKEGGATAETLLAAQGFAWQFANGASTVISVIHRDMAVDLARRDSARRSDFLRAVLHGTIDARRIQAEAAAYGLDASVTYVPVRARPSDASEENAVAVAVRRTGATVHRQAVLGVLEGELVGLAPQRPSYDGPAVVGLGGPCDLTEARRGFLSAGLALDTASAFGRHGTVTLHELGALPLALAADDLAESLDADHFRLLDNEGATGRDVEDTVRTWLELDKNTDEVSQRLFVHRNTVRYRIARFSELTGLDLRTTDGMVTAWWLVTRRHARRSRSSAASAGDVSRAGVPAVGHGVRADEGVDLDV